MKNTQLIRKVLLTAVFSLLLCGFAAANTVSYDITVNTSTINGDDGFVDFTLQPSDSTSQPAMVSITSFATDGTVSANDPLRTGDATGTLPGTVELDNGMFFNDYFHEFQFGSYISFDVTLSGDVLTNPDGTLDGSTFNFSMFAADGFTPLLTSSSEGSAFRVDVVNGTAALTTYPNESGGPSDVHVPEPASLGLLASGALGLLAFRKRRS